MTEPQPLQPGEFLLYETEDGRTRVECRFVEDSLWLTQALMAELFRVKVPTINEHLKTLYAEGEIRPEATIRKFLIVRQEGARRVNRNIDHYNLDAILAVGYRVRSTRGTQFRRWATERLSEYLVKGFTLDDVRLRNAEGEYEQFAAQRRALLESEGAEFNVRTLEEAAKMLPKPKKKG